MSLLADGYHDLPPGKLASVVTSLEMRARPELPPEAGEPGWVLRRETSPAADWYRDLYGRVGGDWLWFARLHMDADDLMAIIGDPDVEIHVLSAGGRDEGYVELDFRRPDECEIAYFGLTRPLQGLGAGALLMRRAFEAAWSRPIERLWVHTCTLDHPGALAFYRKMGFAPYQRRIEIADDPRLTGKLGPEASPQTPRL